MPSASRKLPVARARERGRGLGGDLDRLGRGGAAHDVGDLLDRGALEVEAVAAVDDGRGNLLRLGRRKHEDGVRRGLLERLQERVPGRRGEHVGLIEDVHLAAPADRREGDALAQLADVVDGVVRGGVHLDHVERGGRGDRDGTIRTCRRARSWGRCSQFRHAARILAIEVLPVPREPTNR